MSSILDANKGVVSDNDPRLPTYFGSPTTPIIFNYRSVGDHSQTWTVPDNVYQITIKMWGAAGGGNNGGDAAGGGGYAYDIVPVTAGDVLNVIVGQGGSIQGASTYGGGGSSSSICSYNGGSGGGRSEVSGPSLSWRLIAGGGGGEGLAYAGAGGGITGQNSSSSRGGQGGTGSAGGSGGVYDGAVNGNAGSANTGGNGVGLGNACSGGGGGGYYGGGSGGVSSNTNRYSGGGGSGHGVTGNAVLITGNAATPGNSSDSSRNGAGQAPGANGLVIISYIPTDKTHTFSGKLQLQSTSPATTGPGQIAYDGTNIVMRGSDGSNRFAPAVPSGIGGTLYDSGSDWLRLAPGTSGQFMQLTGTTPPVAWSSTQKATLTNSYTGSDESLSGTAISFTSVVISANSLVVGSVYHATFSGSAITCVSSNAIKIYIGTNAITLVNGPLASGTSWKIQVYLTCRSTGSSGSVAYCAKFEESNTLIVTSGTVTVNTTGTISIYTYIDSGSGTQTQAIGLLMAN